jgi:tryptophanyl-tRNA synthetase
MKIKKRLLTAIQSSGVLHIGNYFGALKPFVDIYHDYNSHIMVADLHALTSVRDAHTLRQNIIDVVKDYIAVGIDPKEAVIFKQSDISEHTELAWIFECLVSVPFLMQAHAYKDKVAKGIEPTAGLFNYPMLMAADILLYDTDVVPVGEDQRQHIEYAREAMTKFNNAFGEMFTPPQEMILSGVGIVPGTDGKKMSKSYKNTIPLFDTKDAIAKAVMSIVTDSSGDRPHHVYAIHTLFKTKTELESIYETHKGRYGDLKKILIEDIETLIAPMRYTREHITDAEVYTVLKDGGDKARTIAHAKMQAVRERIGVV